ncbi:MAG: hypothetical protein K6C35_08635 [Eubacterium sp.]|nr:hypothetical protein [Eubacterium sp.]
MNIEFENELKKYKEILLSRDELLQVECPIIEYKYWELIEDMQAEVFRKKLLLMEKKEPERDFSKQYAALDNMEKTRAEITERYKEACCIKFHENPDGNGHNGEEQFVTHGQIIEELTLENIKEKTDALMEEIRRIKMSFPYNKRFLINSPKAVARQREKLQKLIDEYERELAEI